MKSTNLKRLLVAAALRHNQNWKIQMGNVGLQHRHCWSALDLWRCVGKCWQLLY